MYHNTSCSVNSAACFSFCTSCVLLADGDSHGDSCDNCPLEYVVVLPTSRHFLLLPPPLHTSRMRCLRMLYLELVID